MLLIDWLAKVANDSFVQSAGPDVVIVVGCHEDRRNRIPRADEVSVELESGHRGHLDVGDQAGGFGKAGGMRGNQQPMGEASNAAGFSAPNGSRAAAPGTRRERVLEDIGAVRIFRFRDCAF
jgi:hypothetical protein